MLAEDKETLSKHLAATRHYLENALSFLDQGEVGKASEFLWGSMAQALKLVAAWKGGSLRSHRDLWGYAQGLAKELGDPSIFEAFLKANTLHSNFYEVELRLQDVALLSEDIRAAVGKLISLLPEEVRRELAQQP